MNPALFERTSTPSGTPHMLWKPISVLPQEFGYTIGLVIRDFIEPLDKR